MDCVCRGPGCAMAKMTAVTIQMKPTAPITSAVTISSLVTMGSAYPETMYATENGTALTAQMKTLGCAKEHPPHHAPGVLLIAVMGHA